MTAITRIVLASLLPASMAAAAQALPNIVLIYADDLGYGDVGCYGATAVRTPHIDALAREGLRFTDAHAAAATCTPSRYALLTGRYAFRKKGTGVLSGAAKLSIDPERRTLADLLQAAGYATAVVGKWHLGLGDGQIDWNASIRPGPLEIGFDTAFIIPATGDRVPCVFVRDRGVVGLDPNDPIQVSYRGKIGDDPTGKDHPELLKMMWSHGHNATIVNGISRIGYMAGGRTARWVDEHIADTLVREAVTFLERNQTRRFFLYFSTHDIHVPRVPHPRFVGNTDMGPRGDAIAQLDACTGEVLATLGRLGLVENTLVIFSSDNGPVLDDGYRDQAAERVGEHRPAGPLRGGKYSNFDAGTRVPFIVRWPGRVRPGVSRALISQVDLFASLARFTGQSLATDDAPDSLDVIDALLGRSPQGRDQVVEQARTLSLVRGPWKYIRPNRGAKVSASTGIELGTNPQPQLYRRQEDVGERRNVAADHPEIVSAMAAELDALERAGRSRPQ